MVIGVILFSPLFPLFTSHRFRIALFITNVLAIFVLLGLIVFEPRMWPFSFGVALVPILSLTSFLLRKVRSAYSSS